MKDMGTGKQEGRDWHVDVSISKPSNQKSIKHLGKKMSSQCEMANVLNNE